MTGTSDFEEQQNTDPMDRETGFISFVRQLAYLFSRREKLGAIVLLALMLAGAVLEMTGIGAIPAYVAVLSNPEVLDQYPRAQRLMADLGLVTREQLALWGALGLIGIYLIKNGFLTVFSFAQTRYTTGRQVSLASRLFRAYVLSPYAFHLQRNSAESLRNLSNEVFMVIYKTLHPLQNLVKETLMLLAILTLLIVVEPLITLIIIVVLGGSGLLFYTITRNMLSRNAEVAQSFSENVLKVIIEGTHGIKDVKVFGREAFFLQRHEQAAHANARMVRYNNFILTLPPLFLETIGVVVMLGVTALLVQQGHPIVSLMPTLALFGVAAFRLMPMFNRLMMALSLIRDGLPSVKVVYRDLKHLEQHSHLLAMSGRADMPLLKHAIQLEQVTFQYEGAKAPALKEITMEIPCGSAVAFVGPTGSGKTTLVDVILGLLAPAEGRILIDGVDIQADILGWRRQIGYIPQTIYLTDDSIRRNIAFGLDDAAIDEVHVRKVLEMAQLKTFVEQLPQGLNTFIGEQGIRLSGGQRQRIGIARALYHDPQILIMDEATAALDNETERRIVEALNQLRDEHTVIMIAHRLSTVRDCDVLFFLKDGKVEAAGTYEELLALHQDFAAMAT